MKKIPLFMVPLVALSFASCEKDNGNGELSGDDIIQFEDAHFLQALLTVQEIRLYDSEHDEYIDYLIDVDANKDGQITVNEAKNVRALSLYYYDEETEEGESFNVWAMPEIKYFTSLELLDCSENQLVSLDLSKNTALKGLYCYENKLTSLDVSKNSALETLSCGDNQLTSLDVSKNISLIELYCEGNKLTSLDISKNTSLEYFDVSDNPLTSLDLSKNTALIDLSCNNNQLTSIDVSDLTSLGYLNCNDNKLISLDLSNNNDLNDVMCSGNLLTKVILNKKYSSYWWLTDIIREYGDIIEYVD